MCGHSVARNFNNFDSSFDNLFGLSQITKDKIFEEQFKLADPLNISPARHRLEQDSGYNKRQQYRSEYGDRQTQAFLKMQYAPAAPERTATFVNPNAELRDRRRRAVLLGQSQLEMPGVGAGGLGGGGYGGANVPLS